MIACIHPRVIGIAVEVISVCLEEETCFEYWGKVGTDCLFHRLVKWLLPRSTLAQKLLPHFDNWVCGQKWKPKAVAPWVQYSPTR